MLAVALLAGYWLILLVVPVPGVGAYVLTPEGNLAGYVDRLLIPGRFCCYTFGDNEGLLSTYPRSPRRCSASWRCTGFGRNARRAARRRDSSPPAWSPGPRARLEPVVPDQQDHLDELLRAVRRRVEPAAAGAFYWVIDVRGWRRWAFPFVVIGDEPITIYVAQALLDFGIVAGIFTHGFIHRLGPVPNSISGVHGARDQMAVPLLPLSETDLPEGLTLLTTRDARTRIVTANAWTPAKRLAPRWISEATPAPFRYTAAADRMRARTG